MKTNLRCRLSKAPAFFAEHYFLSWTLLFLAAAVPVFSFFAANGKTLVMAGDGFMQHYKALLYFSRWMRSVIKSLLIGHTLSIPTFSFSFGLGSDLFTTLQYYVIGDPFALLCFLVSTRYMLYYYELMIILRLYCAGMAFSALARYHRNSPAASLAGSVTYSFCSWVTYASVKHPYFTNPMIFLPLLLLGVDKYRKEKKPGLFIAMVALSAASNFYFFYMLVLLTVAYVLLKSFIPFQKDQLKNRMLTILKLGGCSLIGVLISSVLLLPVLLLFFGDERSRTGYTPDLLYAAGFYSKLPSSLITSSHAGHWTFAGTSAVSVLAVFLLLKKSGKNRLRMKITYLAGLIGLALPYVGFAFNGFSYSANRWSWAFSFLTAYILTDLWPDLFRLTKKEILYLSGCLALYFTVCFMAGLGHLSANYYVSFGLAVVALPVLILCRRSRGQGTASVSSVTIHRMKLPRQAGSVMMLLFLLAGIGENAYFALDPGQRNYVAQFCSADTFQKKFNFSEAMAIQQAADTGGFYRYSGSRLVRNTSLFTGLKNTQIYWSLTNGNVTGLYDKTLTTIQHISNITGFDSRTFLEELASTKYYVVLKRDTGSVPYGYKLVSKSSLPTASGKTADFRVYENQYALPLGYTYSSAISEEAAKKLTPLQRQEAMLDTVILKSRDTSLSSSDLPESEIRSADWSMQTSSDEISRQGNSFVVTKPGESITLSFEGTPDSETYLSFNNLQFQGLSAYKLYQGKQSYDPLGLYGKKNWNTLPSGKRDELHFYDTIYNEPSSLTLKARISSDDSSAAPHSKDLFYETSRYHWYNGRKDFLINMGYCKEARNTVSITFPERGIYSFDSLNIYCQPMKNYAAKTEALKQDTLENVDLHENEVYATNHVTGTISLDENKILCLSVPYSDGWTAYVDGKKAELMKANYAYMALDLEKGDHEIELVYHTPGLKTGALLSGTGLIMVFAAAFFRKKNKIRYSAE